MATQCFAVTWRPRLARGRAVQHRRRSRGRGVRRQRCFDARRREPSATRAPASGLSPRHVAAAAGTVILFSYVFHADGVVTCSLLCRLDSRQTVGSVCSDSCLGVAERNQRASKQARTQASTQHKQASKRTNEGTNEQAREQARKQARKHARK